VAVAVTVTVAWVPSSMYCVNPGVAGVFHLGGHNLSSLLMSVVGRRLGRQL